MTEATACLLLIGNEILSGRTKDANLPYIALGLNSVGVRLREARVIPDVAETIVATVNEVRAKFTYVFTTGGIGPTHDDITAECVARAFGVPLILHPEAHRRLLAWYKPGELNEARLRMAHVPEGASLIDNPVSRAPGFRIGNVFVMAGVPEIMRAMFDSVKHTLEGGRPLLSRAVNSNVAEGVLAEGLGAIQARFPMVEIGSYPYFRRGAAGTSLVLRATEPGPLAEAFEAVMALVRSLGGEPFEEPMS